MAVDPRALLLAQMAGGGAPPDLAGGPPALPDMPLPAGGPGPGPPGPGPTDDPLDALQQVIQDLHALIGLLDDPAHTRIASQCLTALTGIQKDLMQPAGAGAGGPAGAGGGGGVPPGY